MKNSMEARQASIVRELQQFAQGEVRGLVVGLKVQKPRPWGPSHQMIRLRDEGCTSQEIAEITGYAVVTVERALQTRGEDRRPGSQCVALGMRTFTSDVALAEMPLPCSDDCACYWSPVFRHEAEQAGLKIDQPSSPVVP